MIALPQAMRGDKKDQNLQTVSNILEGLFQSGQGPLADRFRRDQLDRKWVEVVGPVVSSYSRPVQYRDGVLWVWARSSAHLQELSFGVDLLKSKINQHFGFVWVEHIKLTLDLRQSRE